MWCDHEVGVAIIKHCREAKLHIRHGYQMPMTMTVSSVGRSVGGRHVAGMGFGES